jgi:alpha-L-rhamnosidase
LHVLTRFGRTDLAYKILLQEDYPSWLYTVRNGATTMWERWNSYTKEHGFGDVGMNSFNHYAYGAVGEWMYAVIGGLRPLAPGYKKIIFAPEPGGGLTSAYCELDTPQGRAACRWQLRGKTLRGEVEVPPRTKAELRLPGQRAKTLSPGHHRFAAKLRNS